MASSIKITLPELCSQNWNEMLPTDKGRFCSSCQKTVIDFSLMTDKQILDYFTNYKGNVCGSFSPTQLSRQINSSIKSPKTSNLKRYLAAIFGLFLSLNIRAQSNSDTVRIQPKSEIMPLKPSKINPVIQEVKEISGCDKQLMNQLQGKLGGVVVEIIDENDKSRNIMKSSIFITIEDILRRF